MPEIEYAIEVESRTSISNADYGITDGFFRFITGRPAFVALGDSVAFSVTIDGLEDILTAFASGQLYQASNPPFKIANTVPTIGMVFTVLGTLDFTGGELTTAKGSAPANGDMFRVDQNGEGDVDALPENLSTFGQNGDLDVLLISTFGYLNSVNTDPVVSYVGVNIWYNNFIVKNGLGTPSRDAGKGIEKTGDYGTLSGFKFTIKNTNKIWKFLESNEIYIINKECRLYAVIDEVFYQIWEGVVNNLPRNDTSFSFDCGDAFKKYHKTFPPNTITQTEFPAVISDFIGETIPVAIGDVVYNKILNVAEQTISKYNTPVIAYFPDGDLTAGGWGSFWNGVIPGGTEGKPTIYVRGLTNFASIEDAYIRFIQGGEVDKGTLYKVVNFGRRLSGGGINTPEYWQTLIVLDSPIQGLDEQTYDYFFNNIGVKVSAEAKLSECWCNIISINYQHLVSDHEIKEFIKVSGIPILLNWVEDNNAYMNVSRLVIDSRIDTGGSPAHPHISTLGRTVTDDGSIEFMSRLLPVGLWWKSVSCQATGTQSQSVPEQADFKDSVVNMDDLHRSTYCEFCQVRNFSGYSPSSFELQVSIDLHVNGDLLEDAVEKLYMAFDWSYTLNSGVGKDRPDSYHYKLVAVDDLGREYEPDAENDAVFDFPSSNSELMIHLPDSYYEGGYTGGIESDWGKILDQSGIPKNMIEVIEVSSDALQPIQNGVASGLRLKLVFSYSGSISDVVDFLSLRIHEIGFLVATNIDLIGDKMYTRVKGEYSTSTDSIESNNVHRAFQLMLEKYDEIPPDRIDYFNMYMRDEWHVGRQITKQQDSFNYLKELCKQSFVCIVPTREGKRRVAAWLDHPFPVDVHDNTEICDGSIKNFALTPISSLYNSFGVQYAYNPARNDYDKEMFIRKVDEDLTDLPVVDWGEYVGGIDDYITANLLWKACRHAYLKAELIQPAPDELSKLNWYIDYDLFSELRSYSGVNSPAFLFLYQFVFWTVYQKGNITYQLPINATNIVFCELLNYITFNDIIYTDGEDWGGWIRKVKYLLNKDRIELKLIFQPRDQYDDGLIIERGDMGDDTITERGDQGDDTITEGGV